MIGSKKSGRRNRTRLEIILDILLLIERRGKAKKTWIMYGANLSFRYLNRYLTYLLDSKLIEKVIIPSSKSEYYELTEKGRNVAKALQEVKEMIEWI